MGLLCGPTGVFVSGMAAERNASTGLWLELLPLQMSLSWPAAA
jgi:hypothetical protein